LLALGFLLCLGLTSSAGAQTCSASASSINFGSVSPISNNAVNATGTISVTCQWPAITFTPNALVCLNLGAPSPRELKHGGQQMQYDLYQDPAHSLTWGSIYNGTTPISLTLSKPATGNSVTQVVTVYGQVAGNQPTVPSVGNGNTVYRQEIGGNWTSLNYLFYPIGAPSCVSLILSVGAFPFSVVATVINNCSISTSNINFATVSVLSTALNSTGSITARCTNGDAYRIALSAGTSGNVVARQLQRTGGGAVNYQLYVDANHTTAWGDGTQGTTMPTGVGSGNPQVLTVYGRIPAQTTPEAGVYSDVITATITF